MKFLWGRGVEACRKRRLSRRAFPCCREGLGAFCFFSPFDDRTFPGNGYIIRNVCDDAALFST
ncbi:hypothetical protein CXT94_04395 [Akkermansia muciniphila]|nr:hypothetical protein CXT94_04395 [Akkermansia muciniphila]